jgi:hypothetical protein
LWEKKEEKGSCCRQSLLTLHRWDEQPKQPNPILVADLGRQDRYDG